MTNYKITSHEVRAKYINYFVRQQHTEIPAVSLLPENDASLLFVNSGMFPLVPYLLGADHPQGTRLVNYQKCFRSGDIEEVGDGRHTTFFEMLGNWSLGDYFKTEQLKFWYSFLVEEIGLDASRLYQSVYAGSESAPRDEESISMLNQIFEKYGVSHGVGTPTTGPGELGCGEEIDFTTQRIFPYTDKNRRQRGNAIGEVGGPDTETFYDTGKPHNPAYGAHCHINCDCGRFIEIGNSVFIQYVLTELGWQQIARKNVDFGGGLERVSMVANGLDTVFKTDIFAHYIDAIETATGKKYDDNRRPFEIIVDHMRASVFLIGDGMFPSNKDQGYYIRRLIRSAVMQANKIGLSLEALGGVVAKIIEYMGSVYTNLPSQKEHIIQAITKEANSFQSTVEKSTKFLDKIIKKNNCVSGEDAFILQTTYGLPFEIIKEITEGLGLSVDEVSYRKKVEEHKEISRQGMDQKFKSGLADNSEIVTKYHTATHLLHAALRTVLGDGVAQKGSNITSERLRFDFSYDQKMTPEQIAQVEHIINTQVANGFTVKREDMDYEAAKDSGAIGLFADKYDKNVSVFTVTAKDGTIISKEICTGPHVENSDNFGTFKITKEEASSQGIRRIKGELI